MHVDTDLSAYLDGELPPAGRARVEAHVDACDRCRARLSELRATTALVAALPSPRPARSLVPRVATRFTWLRPVRSLSAVASGAFLFVFLVTAVARSGGGLGGGTTTPFGAPAPAAPAATAAPLGAVAAGTPPALPPPTAVPAPAAADAARGATASPGLQFAQQATAPAKVAQGPTASPPPREDAQRSAEALAVSGPQEATRTSGQPAPSPVTDPLLWLGLTVVAAIVAIGAHWRLRTT